MVVVTRRPPPTTARAPKSESFSSCVRTYCSTYGSVFLPNSVPRFRPSFVADAAVNCGLRDDALVEHRLQHLGATVTGRLRVDERVVAARRLRQSGQQRGLRDRQVGRPAAEVDLRGGLRAVREVAVRDGVEVLLEDPLLGVLLLELLGHQRLVQLALQRHLARDLREDVADQLLGQRGAALLDLAGLEVLDGGAADGLPVDAVVLVEAAVLDRDGGLRQPRRDLRRAAPAAGSRSSRSRSGACRRWRRCGSSAAAGAPAARRAA